MTDRTNELFFVGCCCCCFCWLVGWLLLVVDVCCCCCCWLWLFVVLSLFLFVWLLLLLLLFVVVVCCLLLLFVVVVVVGCGCCGLLLFCHFSVFSFSERCAQTKRSVFGQTEELSKFVREVQNQKPKKKHKQREQRVVPRIWETKQANNKNMFFVGFCDKRPN